MGQIENLLRSLNAADVRYVVIGATAFAAHGWVRAAGRPKDLADLEQLEKLAQGEPDP